MQRYLLYTLIVIVVVVVAAEAFLRMTGRFATYSESIGQKYSSYYDKVERSWYLVHTPNDTTTLANSDFHYPYSTNKYGIRERDFEKDKSDTALRIFVTGDSFAEGQGAPFDSTWPHLLARKLVGDGMHAEVINTGVAGSDPLYNYVLHRDILKGYKSDYLIVCINSSDFIDYLMRGGFERFYKDGTTHFRKGPWYHPIYRRSYFARAVIEKACGFPFRGVFSTEQDLFANTDSAIACYNVVVDSFVNLVRPDSTKIIVLLYSTPSDVRFKTPETTKFREEFISLQQQLTARNIPCINLWDDIAGELAGKNYLEYSYRNDWHFNPYGYDLMARLVEKKLIEENLIAKK